MVDLHPSGLSDPSGQCSVRDAAAISPRERGVRAVVLLTAVMMVIEIAAGYLTGSMALLADGWHMATHVAALGLASGAYSVARRYASDRVFAFGTGKINSLAGYTSGVALGGVALLMVIESISRLSDPIAIDYASSLPVAVVGLLVNLVSAALLHHDDADSVGAHTHDHNHRAAFAHVLADTLTSALAIVALLAGWRLGWGWMDPLSGVAGGILILGWATTLCRSAAGELLDMDPASGIEDRVRAELAQIDGVSVRDLHVWPLGYGRMGCVVTIETASHRDPQVYRDRVLAVCPAAHLTIEVHLRREQVLPS